MVASGQSALQGEIFASPSDRSMPARWAHGIWKFIRTKPLGTFGAFIVLVIIFLAIFAKYIAPYNYDHQVISARLQSPSWKHLMGTDEQGRDMLSRIIYGARIAAWVGFGSTLLATFIASVVGMISGFFSGTVDNIIQRIVDVFIAFPALILLLAIISILGTPTAPLHLGVTTVSPSDQRMVQIIGVLGLLFSFGSSRIIRSATLAVRNNLYVEGARTVGASDTRIILQYILPNVMPTIIIIASLFLAGAILAEATLSFLGFGIPPPAPSWGAMLSGRARSLMRVDPWLAVWPGVAISLAVYGFNMLGDALRDVLDPRLRGSR
jgi:peptide/nickel transport system permease protein